MKQEKLKLRLVNGYYRDYKVETPKRHSNFYEATVRLKVLREEFMYIPRLREIMVRSAFTSDELRAIADKLDKLNMEEF